MTFVAIDRQLLATAGDPVWELYHENSKMSRHERHSIFALPPSDARIVQTMNQLRTVKPYRDYPRVNLPDTLPASTRALDEVLLARETAREFGPGEIYLEQLAKALYMAYGITRDNVGSPFPRPFRTIPSGGALYPLEIYIHATRVRGLEPGLYHYDPEDSFLDILTRGDESATLASYMFQEELARNAAVMIFVSAVFIRSTFKYSDRGYRFVLIEAGHLGQNVILTAREMGLAVVPMGGYLDRDVDRHLGLDGLEESVVYLLLLGREAANAEGPRSHESIVFGYQRD